jgi:hypothetical protein
MTGMRVVCGLAVVCSLPLSGCDDSVQERFERFNADADIVCWEYNGCAAKGGYGPATSPPSVPIEQGVTCMNDALASGARAVASWGTADFAANTLTGTYVFTVDHQIKVFELDTFSIDPTEYYERPSCTGPFRVDPDAICGVTDTGPGHLIPVNALAWDGCP